MTGPLPTRPTRFQANALVRFCAIAALVAIAACTQRPEAPPAPMVVAPPAPTAANPLDRDMPAYLRLPGQPDGTPVRVGVILPFSSGAAGTRALASSMLKAAELAMFDAGNRNILLMTADEANTQQLLKYRKIVITADAMETIARRTA